MTVFSYLAIIGVCIPGLAVIKFVLIVAFWSWLTLTRRFAWQSVVWMCSVLLCLLVWMVVAQLQGVAVMDAADHFARIMIFFLVLGIAGYFVGSGLEVWRVDELDGLIFRMAVLAMLLKVTLLAMVLGGVLTFQELEDLLGVKTVTDSIGLNLKRLQFPSDIVVLFLLSCYVGGRGRVKDAIFLISAAIVAYLSFSRFIFFGFGFALLVRAFWLRRIDWIMALSMLVGAALLAISFDRLYDRFIGADVVTSDAIRDEQVWHLSRAIATGSVFGGGLGAGLMDYVRNAKEPYFYEVQWYAMAYQFGFIGLSWLAANFVWFFCWCLKRPINIFYFTSVILVWLLSGFTNPYLTGLGSVFGIAILLFRSNVLVGPMERLQEVNDQPR